MYNNQSFDFGGFHNDINQHLSNMTPFPFACQSSTIPELTEAQLCSMTGEQIDAYWQQVESSAIESNVITQHSTQPGRIYHTIPATTPSDSFYLQNEYTNPYEGTRGAYPASSSTMQARHQYSLTQDAGVVNDVLDQNELL